MLGTGCNGRQDERWSPWREAGVCREGGSTPTALWFLGQAHARGRGLEGDRGAWHAEAWDVPGGSALARRDAASWGRGVTAPSSSFQTTLLHPRL